MGSTKARSALVATSLVVGCGQMVEQVAATGTSGGGTTTGTGGVAQTASSSAAASSSSAGGAGGTSSSTAGAGTGGAGGVPSNPCGSKCGPVELCDPDHLGLDDNCDGQVDEGCLCAAGTAHWCFKGDPSYHGAPGCFDGTELCLPSGTWGPCTGGVHATPPDNCFLNDTSSCHAISTRPFVGVHLETGTGTFSGNAVPGSEAWTVTCPSGVSPCPGVSAGDLLKPLQSGEYTITYTKLVQGSGPASCTYPLFVGARGMRIELSWEHTTADTGVDLDLHVHQPNDTKPWGILPAVEQDCTWANCVFNDFQPPQNPDSPTWFADPPAKPPTPVNWWLDPVPENNTCVQPTALGCHNPRLDADNITCDASVTDPTDPTFCKPENINIDYPPTGQWTRIGVNYYNNHGLGYDVHPLVKVFCDGALAGQLGPAGYYVPEAPVTFEPADGAMDGGGGNRFWVVADVAFAYNACNVGTCTVQPVYSDASEKTPFFAIDTAVTKAFAPGYPPGP